MEIFNTCLHDNVKAREQDSDGVYHRVERSENEAPLNSQIYFYEQAYKAAEEAAAQEEHTERQRRAEEEQSRREAQIALSPDYVQPVTPVPEEPGVVTHRVKIRRVKR